MQARKMLTKRRKIRVRSAVMFPAVFGGTVGGCACVPQGDCPPPICGGTHACSPGRSSSPHLWWERKFAAGN